MYYVCIRNITLIYNILYLPRLILPIVIILLHMHTLIYISLHVYTYTGHQ